MMKMATKSPYTDYEYLTSKHSGKRAQKVMAFVIHHMAGVMTGKQCAQYFQRTTRQASANYCIGPDGDVALNVGEENRAWTSSSNWADQRAITFELSNSKYGGNWHVSDEAINKLILMLAEQHQRYGLKKCTYTGDTNGTLWRHDWFAPTNCPGPYLGSKFPYIAAEVNKILNKGTATKPTAKPQPQKPATTSPHYYDYPPGRYRVLPEIGLNVRDKPDTGNIKTALPKSSEFNAIEQIRGGVNGVWLKRDDGNYISAQQGNVIHVKRISDLPQSKPTAKTSGKWLVTTPDGMKVRSAPSTSAEKVASYQAGQTVNINSTVTQNGYIWGVYTSYSGYTRYIALQPVNGAAYGKWI